MYSMVCKSKNIDLNKLNDFQKLISKQENLLKGKKSYFQSYELREKDLQISNGGRFLKLVWILCRNRVSSILGELLAMVERLI